MAQPQVHNGYNYYQQPDGTWKRGEAVAAPAPIGGVVLPPAPPKPQEAPPRTPAGAATEGAPKGFAWVDPNNPSAGVVPIQGLPETARDGSRPEQEPLTAKARVDAEQAAIDAQALFDLAQQLKVRFNQGPGATSGIYGFGDFLPTESNRTFNDLGQQARGLVKRAMGFTGGEGNTATESSAIYDPFLPRAGDLDGQILDKIAALEGLATRSATLSSNLLGKPLPAFAGGEPDQQAIPGNALDMIRLQGGGGPGGAVPLADSSTEQYQTVANPALERAHNDLVASLIQQGGGRLDPQAYAQGFAQLAQEFGVNDRNAAGRAEWAQAMNAYLDAGGRTLPTTLNTQEVMSAGDIARNNLVNNPVSATAIGAANTLGFGLPEAFAPGQMAALRDSQTFPMVLGEIGGAIGGTGAVSTIGRNTIGRAIPRLMGQQGVPASQGLSNFARGIRQGREQTLGQVGRNIAADATYGGIYGATTEGDPLTGVALGTIGSAVGQTGGRTLGAMIGGAQRTAAAQALMDRGVPVSVARQLGLGRVEDVMQSLPLAGDVARARQADSFQGFNQAAFDIGASPATQLSTPVQIAPGAFGRDGVTALKGVERQAYNNTLGNVNVGIDPQFTTDFAALARQVGALPGDYQTAATQVVANRVGPAVNSGAMTGKAYQQAIRGLRSAKSKASNVGATGFEDNYVAALNSAEDALTGVIKRNAGANVVDDLGLANEVYSNRKILENASLERAKIGTRSGEINVFTPSQLLEATSQAEKRYGTGAALREFGEQGQRALPTTLPNSGTIDRAIALGAVPTAAGAIGGGVGFTGAEQDQGAQGAVSGTGMGLGTLAATSGLLALLGTRGGQKALEQILISRPQIAQRAGRAVRRRGGLFGSAGSAMALQGQ